MMDNIDRIALTMLAVVGTVFILLIIVYVRVPKDCSTICKRFHVYLRRSSIKKCDFQENDFITKCDGESCYPFLVALMHYNDNDDWIENTFAGSGVLVTRTWVLTVSSIVKKHISNPLGIRIRAVSKYWNKDGIYAIVDKIKLADYFTEETMVLLHLFESLGKTAVPMGLSSLTSITSGAKYAIYGWNVNHSLPQEQLIKNSKSIKTHVTMLHDNGACADLSLENNTICGKASYTENYKPCYYELGFLLVDENSSLLGIKSGEFCESNASSIHMYHDVRPYAEWIKNITNM